MSKAHENLTDRIRRELEQEPGLGSDRIAVEVRDGVVTLKGDVACLEATCRASRSVMRVPGTHAVINELSVRQGVLAR